jgi:hypothetical protein
MPDLFRHPICKVATKPVGSSNKFRMAKTMRYEKLHKN